MHEDYLDFIAIVYYIKLMIMAIYLINKVHQLKL